MNENKRKYETLLSMHCIYFIYAFDYSVLHIIGFSYDFPWNVDWDIYVVVDQLNRLDRIVG